MPEKQLFQRLLHLIIILFFALISLLFALSNFCDLLISVGALPASMPFRSGNLALIETVVANYGLSAKVAIAMLSLQTFWLLLISDAFMLSGYYHLTRQKEAQNWTSAAFLLAVTLCFVQLLFLEAFIYHQLTEKLMVTIIFLLLCWSLLKEDKATNHKHNY